MECAVSISDAKGLLIIIMGFFAGIGAWTVTQWAIDAVRGRE